MPTIKSAKKRMELSRAANARNRAARSKLRTAIKRVRQAEDAEQGRERLRFAHSLLDKAAAARLYHPNKAARIKSQLARHVESLQA